MLHSWGVNKLIWALMITHHHSGFTGQLSNLMELDRICQDGMNCTNSKIKKMTNHSF